MFKLQLEKDTGAQSQQRKIVIGDAELSQASDSNISDINDLMSSDVLEEKYVVHEGSVIYGQEQGEVDPY